MSDAAVARPAPTRPASYSRERYARTAIGLVFLGLFVANIVAIVWIWVANHNLDFRVRARPDRSAWMARLGGLTGLLGAYLALVQVLLLARLPFLGRVDRLRPADRLAPLERLRVPRCSSSRTPSSRCYGYAIDAAQSASSTSSGSSLADDFLSGMVTATIGLALFVARLRDARSRSSRRRLTTSSGTRCTSPPTRRSRFAWFHQIPTGGDLALAFHARRDLLARPLLRHARACSSSASLTPALEPSSVYRLRVAEVIAEGPTVTSIRITGRGLDGCTRGRGSSSSGGSSRAGSGGRRTRSRSRPRPTAARSGSASRPPATTPRGCGRSRSARASSPRARTATFTEAVAAAAQGRCSIAGGIGITPVRALAETMDGDLVVIYRVLVGWRHRLPRRARPSSRRGAASSCTTSSAITAADEGRDLLSTAHLRELVPDLAERDVYLCGPPAMVAAIENVRDAGVPRRRAPRRAVRALGAPQLMRLNHAFDVDDQPRELIKVQPG